MQMATAVVEDLSGSIEIIIFPKTFDMCAAFLNPDLPVGIKGRVDRREGEAAKIIADKIFPIPPGDEARGQMHITVKRGKEYIIDKIRPVIMDNLGNDELVLNVGGKDYICNYGIDLSREPEKSICNYIDTECVKVKRN